MYQREMFSTPPHSAFPEMPLSQPQKLSNGNKSVNKLYPDLSSDVELQIAKRLINLQLGRICQFTVSSIPDLGQLRKELVRIGNKTNR